jgi:glycosyltransferase involved in cell wall biosynthesis
VKILRISHSAVVGQWRERERLLRRNHGYEVELVCAPAWREGTALIPAAPSEPDLPVHVVPVHGRMHPILFWYEVRALARVIRGFGPDLIDVQEEPYSLAAVSIRWAARLAGSRAPMCVFTAQNIRKRYPQPFRHWERTMYRRASAAYPCSVEAEDVLRAKGYPGRTMVIPLGVRPGEVATRERSAGTVGFVGRLTPEKGPQLLLAAVARLRGSLDLTLELVGSGPQDEELRREADRFGIADAVTFTGAVPPGEVLERIERFSVLVVPSLATKSWQEQFCRVAVEALAVGTPVLSARSGSLPSVLGTAAEYFAEGDVDDLTAQLERLLGDADRRRSLAAAGLERVEQRFRWERVAEQFDALYRQVLADA